MSVGNLERFRERPGFLQALCDAPDDFTLERSRAGALVPVRRSDGAWLGSRYDPGKEAQRWTLAQAFQDDDLPVIVGYLPYAIKECAARPMIVVEKDPSLLKAALAGIELGDALDGVVVTLDDHGAKLESAIRSVYDPFRHSKVRVVLSPFATDFEWTARIAEAALIVQREFAMNLLSSAYQLPKWLITMMKNLETYVSSPDAAVLENLLAGETAIIVAAGPSLDRNIAELRLVNGRAPIVAVDTALRAMEAAGVRPDIVVSVDTNDANAMDVDGLTDSLGAILVADQIASSEVVEAFRGPKIFLRSINFILDQEGRAVRSDQPIDRFIADLAGRSDVPSWQSGGSVSTNAFCLAHYMGMRRVILVGQDLAFTGGRTHVKGVGYEDARTGLSQRFTTLETQFHRTTSEGRIVVDSWDGGKVETNEVMREFLRWYEKTMSHGFGQEMEVIDATEGGALIRGTKAMTLRGALETLPARSDFAARLSRAIAGAPAAGRPGVKERISAKLGRARHFYGESIDGIEEELPIARWLALPAFLGGRDLPPQDRARLHAQALREAARFLVALLTPADAEIGA